MFGLTTHREDFNEWYDRTMAIVFLHKFKNKDYSLIEITKEELKELYTDGLDPIDAATVMMGGEND